MEETPRRRNWPGRLSAAILALGTFAVYRRTFSVPVLLDDYGVIVNNPSIRRLWPIWPALSPPPDAGVAGRPLLNLSFALNYAAGGPAVFGYHLVNLLIHVLAGWTLFALVRHTLRRPILAPRFGRAATPLALAVSAIWAWHPLATESVTYLSQRAESLMGLFYLLTLYCFIRFAERESSFARTERASSFAEATADRSEDKKAGRSFWAGLSVLACLFGMATKEVMVTAPLLVFLYDRTFVSGSFSGAWRRHWPVYVALAATWLPLAYLMSGIQNRGVGFGRGSIAWWVNGIVECRVVVKYLLLAFWPHPLVFDYGKYVETPLLGVWPFALVLGSLLILTVVALRRSPVLGFAACWFLLILAPGSSIVPIVESPMAENRVYLPLAGVAAFAVIGAFALAGRGCLPFFAIAAVALGLAAARRNQVYLSARTLWSDTVAKEPTNARALNNLAGYVLVADGGTPAAIAEYEEALRLQPVFPQAHTNLALALADVPARLNEAIAQSEEALREDPDYAEAHYTLGYAWAKLPGRLNDAIAQYREALRLKPDFFEAHRNLAVLWANLPGHLGDAIAELQAALRLKPDNAEAHASLGNAWLQTPGRLNDAIAQYEAALRLEDIAPLHSNLAYALNAAGRTTEAIAQYEAAIRLDPRAAELHSNLAYALNAAGRTKEAIAQYEIALRLKPDLEPARQILARIRASSHERP